MPSLSPRREVGRPRVYSDETIFSALNLILQRDGYRALTLEAIANEVGCTRQALVRRFGSKQRLILCFLETMLDRLAKLYEQEKKTTGAPLEILHARLTQPWAQRFITTSDDRAQANVLTFILSLGHDPALASRIAAMNGTVMTGLESLLNAAIERGELHGLDPSVTTHVLYTVWIGETINWCVDPTIDLSARLDRALALILDPHRTSGCGPQSWGSAGAVDLESIS